MAIRAKQPGSDAATGTPVKNHLHGSSEQGPSKGPASLSIIHGPKTPALWTQRLGDLIDERARQNGDRVAAVFPWQKHRLSFEHLADRSRLLAKAMLEAGLKHGDTVGIMAGNCYQYLEVFSGAARIGCPFAVFNNTYTPNELCQTLSVSSCKLLFIAPSIGKKSLSPHIQAVCGKSEAVSELQRVVLLSTTKPTAFSSPVRETLLYNVFADNGHSIFMNNATLRRAERQVKNTDVLNLQFTSGTTGAPKAAMLTHFNLINDGRFFGDGLNLTARDVVCSPPPLFHCFGLVMGFLGSLTHSSTVVMPCDQFDPDLVLDAIVQQKCTVLLGVPTMFIAEMEANRRKGKGYKIDTLRLGLASGSPVPVPLMKELRQELGVQKTLIAYGMTETSPVTFMTPIDDPDERRATTVGKVFPHTSAKIIDRNGEIVPRGVPGELCTSGFALQKGYWKNQEKTAEAMKVDRDGVRWMHTGDECVITEDDYCIVTGRIKDLIIRGGENIAPVEIEDRLLEHDAIAEASVVGLKDPKYGEVVGCFLRHAGDTDARPRPRPEPAEIHQWCRQQLGSHKAPAHVFWIGDSGVGDDFPKTGSGKHQKHVLRALGNQLVEAKSKSKTGLEAKVKAKL
ncbi:hypothetical protein A1O3_10202 [Capronia epimyces CBS 606.96]|uniref:Long-chain acyl-CoA synthetase n=1 Tax=Capronia epimyces CBS 606.96 TaxID=1182542 RepID=W9Y3K8_9EURO|nr:uncharacterized protein A1O3_10202 [Capronia epimyces CBS 606.96]EXJ77044.1 hypothetical protein A1O3_10202 [Capronia epimyces CBS 606.96]